MNSLAQEWLNDKDISPNLHKIFLPKKIVVAKVARKPNNDRASASLKRGSVQKDVLIPESLNRTGNRTHKSPSGRNLPKRTVTEREKSSNRNAGVSAAANNSHLESLLEPHIFGERTMNQKKRQILKDLNPKEFENILKSNKQMSSSGNDFNTRKGKQDASQTKTEKKYGHPCLSTMASNPTFDESSQNKVESITASYLFLNKENIAPRRGDSSSGGGGVKRKKKSKSRSKEHNITFKNIPAAADFLENIPLHEEPEPTSRKVKQVSASSLAAMFGKIESSSKQLLDFNKRTALDKSLLKLHGNNDAHGKKPKIKLKLDEEQNYCMPSLITDKKTNLTDINSTKFNPRALSFAQEFSAKEGNVSIKLPCKVGNSYLDLDLLLKKKKKSAVLPTELDEGTLAEAFPNEYNMNIQASKFSRFSRKGYSGFLNVIFKRFSC
jgi:hypothetical protein